ncbi:hypothetical protein [Actinophytocola sp.]|uniref:hypothetical protein n=1 Tax=Actinophytocola sp. TaxID=1872138 RepID=UPI002D806611|nr:hypothetical protein [Actinophytocola sp.]HET9140181.1 hypothetical protein [Actinophytocola sp.]
MARSTKTGVIVGLVLVALLAWFIVPREMGWTGPWVPAALEVYLLHPMLAAVVCEIGTLVDQRRLVGVGRLLTIVLAGFVLAGGALIAQLEAMPGDEGVFPGPAQLRVVIEDSWCGSSNCSRILEANGDRAPEVMREHLASQGFTAAPTITGRRRVCRQTGILVTHEVCAELQDISATAVRVEWYVN